MTQPVRELLRQVAALGPEGGWLRTNRWTYPALRKCEDAGLVEYCEQTSFRGRKVKITSEGLDALKWMEALP